MIGSTLNESAADRHSKIVTAFFMTDAKTVTLMTSEKQRDYETTFVEVWETVERQSLI